MSAERILGGVAAAHLVVGVVAFALTFVDAPAVMGVHPALKPMKFGFSIAIFLGSLALVVPTLSVSTSTQTALAALLSLTMIAEMLPILLQAAQRTTSHFNVSDARSAGLWTIMVGAIVVATLVMAGVAVTATASPLHDARGQALEPGLALAWRAGLWLFLVAAVSGFAMGGRAQHAVGGADGGAGLPLLNWSRTLGDLRVSHFFSLHALQLLPGLAFLLARTPMTAAARVVIIAVAATAVAVLAVATLVQAFAGRPFLR